MWLRGAPALYLIRHAYLIAITDRRRTKGEKSNRTMCEINILYLQSLEDFNCSDLCVGDELSGVGVG